MTIFRSFTPTDQTIFEQLVQNLYEEDPSGKPISLEKIRLTSQTLLHKPDLGEILLMQAETKIIGYAILINFWSNEFGGNILHIDEIFIKQEYRNKGIATEFIKHLAKEKYHQAKALQLEVTPDNHRAEKLYQKLGFEPMENHCLVLDID